MLQRVWMAACALALALSFQTVQAQQPRDGLVESVPAANFSIRSAGALSGTDWRFTTAGHIETREFIVPHGSTDAVSYQLTVTAYGTPAGGAALPGRWPRLEVSIDGQPKAIIDVTATRATAYTLATGPLTAGLHTVRLAFLNPGTVGRQQRTLSLRSAELRMAAPPSLPGNAGFAPMQSVTILNGFFPTNEAFYGLSSPCPAWLTGCRNIAFIQRLGATDVTFTSVCMLRPGEDRCTPQIDANNNEEQALRVAMRHARSLGLTVTLKPFVLSPSGEVLSGYYAPGSSRKWLPADPQVFFDSIEANLVRHAVVAREEGASLLVIGTEFGGRFTSGQPIQGYTAVRERWARLAQNVRAAAAGVSNPAPGAPTELKLTYSPTMSGFWNDLDANEAPYLSFWDSLDYFGFNAYAHMNLVPTTPVTAQLGSGFNAHRRMFVPENANTSTTDDLRIDPASAYGGARFNFSMPLAGYPEFDLTSLAPGSYQASFNTNRYSTKWYLDHLVDHLNQRFMASLIQQNKYPMKAIITETGAPSNRNVLGMWGITEAGVVRARELTVYQAEQARALDGYLRAFHGDPRVVGISLWGLLPQHDAGYGPVPGWAEGYDFNGKAATTEVVCKWFKKAYLDGTCLSPP